MCINIHNILFIIHTRRRRMMRQRGKAELLMQRRIYEAMVHDAHDEHNIRGGVQYWCTEVAWAWVLMSREGFSRDGINSLIRHTRRYDIGGMDTRDRDRITEKLRTAGVSLKLETRPFYGGRPRGRMDLAVGELHEYNARVMTDYRLAACEYLRDVKGFGRRRLERDIAITAETEVKTELLEKMRQDVYRKKGIWIRTCDGDEPEDGAV
jgi:hypothetical protein